MPKQSWWRKPVVVVPAALISIAAVGLALFAFQPWRLFIDVTVNEELPAASEQSTPSEPSPARTPSVDQGEIEAAGNEEATEAPTTRTVTAEGSFISHEHSTAGQARIITLEDGSRVLRITNLDTDNGPDLKVWLAAAPVIEGRDGWFVFDDDDYLDLGPLKGNKGNQNYRIPADADIAKLTSVTIWCDRFSVSFGAAELIPV